MGLPGTIFMDRKSPEKLPAIQLSFIQHLVSPLFQSSAEAGIIPGILVPTDTPTPSPPLPELGKEGMAGESESKTMAVVEDDLDIGDDAFVMDTKSVVKPHKFMSLILTNLHVNYEGWRAELPKEEEDEEKKALEDASKEDKEDNDKPGGETEEEQEDKVRREKFCSYSFISVSYQPLEPQTSVLGVVCNPESEYTHI